MQSELNCTETKLGVFKSWNGRGGRYRIIGHFSLQVVLTRRKSIFVTGGSFTTWSKMSKNPQKLGSYLSQGLRHGGTISPDDCDSRLALRS